MPEKGTSIVIVTLWWFLRVVFCLFLLCLQVLSVGVLICFGFIEGFVVLPFEGEGLVSRQYCSFVVQPFAVLVVCTTNHNCVGSEWPLNQYDCCGWLGIENHLLRGRSHGIMGMLVTQVAWCACTTWRSCATARPIVTACATATRWMSCPPCCTAWRPAPSPSTTGTPTSTTRSKPRGTTS